MTVALVTLAVALLAVIVANQRTIAVLNAAREQERKEWGRDRGALLNRIKPETAQYIAPDEIGPQPQAVSMFSDDDFYAAQDLDKEELAEYADELERAQ